MYASLSHARQLLGTAARTGSFTLAHALHSRQPGQVEVQIPGWPTTTRFRKASSDCELVRHLVERVLPAEYAHAPLRRPQVIFDIGGNIGVTAMLLSQAYPEAHVYSFEPLPENAELLRFNTRGLANVTPVPYALGSRSGLLTYERSGDDRNFGGGGFFGSQQDPQRLAEAPVVAVGDALEELGIARIDLIKIDTEGAEHDVLTSIPEHVLENVSLIVGELHNKPQDAELIEYLGQWFDVELTRPSDRVVYFKAGNPRHGRMPLTLPPLAAQAA